MGLFDKRRTPATPVWMDPVELSQVCAVFETRQPRRVLEWGAGGSTRAWLGRFPFITSLVSVEHHPRWYESVRAQITDPRLSLHHVPPDVPPFSYDAPMDRIADWIKRAEVDPTVMASYVAFPATLGQRFDFVLVDGRARNFCLRAGWQLLSDDGVMVLHDAQRPEYRATLASFPRCALLEPFRQGQVAIIRR